MGFQGVLFNNAITLEEIYSLTPSHLAPGDHNSVSLSHAGKKGEQQRYYPAKASEELF